MFRTFQQLILTALFALFASQASAMFIQPDWLDPTQQGVGTNRYAYSGNDPINRIDPSGNQAIAATQSQEERDETHENNAKIHDDMVKQLLADGFAEDDPQVQEHRDMAARERSRIGVTGTELILEDVASIAIPYGAGRLLGKILGGTASRPVAEAVTEAIPQTTRVGRWMSETEYKAMVANGRIVESTSGLTHVANPASQATFGSQAAKGSVYVEFDISTKSLQSSSTGVSTVVTPNSNAAARLEALGRPVPTQSPSVFNVELLGFK